MTNEQLSTYKPTGHDTVAIPANNPHVRALADAFEMMFAGKSEARELAEKRIPKNLSVEHFDGKVYNARELILSEGIANTPLIQTQYLNTVMEGAQYVRCARTMLRSESMSKGNTLRLPFAGSATGIAPEVPEGAPYRNSNGTYSYRDFTIKKYGEVAPITDEMISDSLYNTMAMEVAMLGQHIENALNYEAIGVIVQNAGRSLDTVNVAANQGIKAIAKAKLELVTRARTGGGFQPDSMIATTDFNSVLEQEMLLTNYWGGQSIITGGTPSVLGLAYGLHNGTINSATYGATWSYQTDGDTGAIVYNRQSAGAYVLREDVTIEDFREPIQDLTTSKARIRFGVNYGIANAACRIIY